MTTRKLLVIFNRLRMGGTETRIIRLLSSLNKSKFAISIIYNNQDENSILLDRLNQIDKLTLVPINKLISFKFIQNLFKINPDIIFSVSNITGIIIPYLIGKRNIYNNEGGNRLRNRSILKYYLDKYVIFRLVKGVICNSHFAKKVLIQNGLSNNKIHVVHNGVEDYKIKPVRSRFSSSCINCVYVGRLYETKNQIDLIKIYNNLSVKYKKNVIFNLVGEGPCRIAIEKETRKCNLENYIILHGEKEQVDQELNRNDIFIFTAFTGESLPNAVIEAMKNALPIVAYNTAGLPELIEDGKNGYLIKNNDTIEFAEKLEVLLESESKRKSFSQYSRKKYEKEFKISTMVNSFEQIFENSFKE